MNIQQKLNLGQSQALTLTPQLREAIELLQLSYIDLATFVQTELDQNPFLESEQPGNSYTPIQTRSRGTESFNFDNILANKITLRDHLMSQIHLDLTDSLDQKIASYLVDCLDEYGYLRVPITDIARSLGIKESHIEKVLFLVQRCDPSGIFARDLSECLKLQLQDLGLLTQTATLVLSNLPLLATHDYKKLAKLCETNEAEIKTLHGHVKTLSPRPALAFGEDRIDSITPDVFITPQSNHGWLVTLNQENLPKVLANTVYYAQVKDGVMTKTDRTFIHSTFQRAHWLVKALDQRAKTLLSVTQAIVKEQEAFLNRGIKFLRPMGLKDVALATGMHESTVSRVTTHKYMETPRGVFELKYFFASKISGEHAGDDHSSQAIRYRIKELIEREDKEFPLSDDKISRLLGNEKINIARRTVSKYREGLKIPPTNLRRFRRTG